MEVFEYKGQTVTLAEAAKIANISLGLAAKRKERGWTIDRIINTPVKPRKPQAKRVCGEDVPISVCLNCKRDKCVYDKKDER